MQVKCDRLLLSILLSSYVLALACNSIPAAAQSTAPNEWTWVGGSNTGAEPQVTGTLGVPAPGNIPFARYQAVTWTDKNGNFWLFGGTSLNDLWEFNPSTTEWTWMGGTGATVYGTMGTPSFWNSPGVREGAAGWTDNKGNLWLFGGHGADAAGTNGDDVYLNDLWKFNPSNREWTWMSGSSTVSSCFNDGSGNLIGAIHCAQAGTYGDLGSPASGNTPGSRQGALTWTDSKGNLWLFGGWSFDVPNQVQYYFNELWEYNTTTNLWAWMGGSSTRNGSACAWNVNLWYYSCGEPGVYGTLGTPASANIPGGRSEAVAWTDSSGDFWLFSGFGFDSVGYIGDTQDLWKYSPSTNQWTWMSGSNSLSTACDTASYGGGCSGPSVYGALGVPAAGNIPTGRDHAVGWSDSNGNFWFYGGGVEVQPNDIANADVSLNDFWEFNPAINQWSLMGGSFQALCGIYCSSSPYAEYGTFQVPAAGNQPGIRFSSAGWTDNNGNLWLFGGEPSLFSGESSIFQNDLWEFQPSTGPVPTAATPTFSVPAGSYSSAQSVTIADTTNGAYVYYTTDGTTPTPTPSSAVFIASNPVPVNVQYSETLKAIAVAAGCDPSAVATAVYTLPPRAATPVISLPTGTYTSFETVTISDATPGAAIYYTIDGSTPTTNSNVYAGPLNIANAYTPLQAVAIAPDYSISSVSGATYTLNLPYAAAPTFSVGSGTYNTPQTVTISDTTPGATIYYQIGTGYPTTSSPVYSGPMTVSSTESIWAMATANNHFPSGATGATYTINPLAPQTAAPTFSVPAGTYTTPQTVTISDSTQGAFIYYTTDGSAPGTNSTYYPSPITIASSETLQAIAMANGDAISAVTSAAYILNLPPPSFSISGTAVNVVAGANSGNTSIVTLTPSGGFAGTINLSCTITPAAANDPATCNIPATATLSIFGDEAVGMIVNTTSDISAVDRPKRFFGPLAGGTALACMLFFFIPARRRRGWSIFATLLLLFFIAGGALSCGGGNGAGGGGGGGGGESRGTTPGTYVITVTGTSGNITQTGLVSLTVQ